MAIKGVKPNKKGESVVYLDVFAQTDELKDAVKELPKNRPGFKSHSMGLEIKETITIEPGKYDIVIWKGFTQVGNEKMTINMTTKTYMPFCIFVLGVLFICDDDERQIDGHNNGEKSERRRTTKEKILGYF